MVWMFISFIFAYPWFPIPLSLPTDSQRHIFSAFIFSTQVNNDEVSFLILAKFNSDLYFVSIYGYNYLSCLIKHRTTIPCYYTILFTFYLSYTKTKFTLKLIIKGYPFWLIVCVINTYFHIHSPFFISWKKNLFVLPTWCRWSANLFDLKLVKEYKLDGCQWRNLGFVVTGWYMPYFHLYPFVFS